MKKLFIFVLIMLLTGCLGEAGQGKLTNVCEKEENTNSFMSKTTYYIKFESNDVYNIKKTDVFQASNINAYETVKTVKSSASDYNNMMKNKPGIVVQVDKDVVDNYTVTYDIDMNSISDEDIEFLSISKERNKLIDILKDQDFKCK